MSRAVALVLVALMAGGCKPEGETSTGDRSEGRQPQPTTSEGPDAAARSSHDAALAAVPSEARATASNGGAYHVAYVSKPSPIPLNEMFELTVWVAVPSEKGKAIRDVQLQVDAAMPEHDHGMNTKPKVAANPDGSFTVTGMLFHMPGHWELYCDVTRGGVTERAQFDVELE